MKIIEVILWKRVFFQSNCGTSVLVLKAAVLLMGTAFAFQHGQW